MRLAVWIALAVVVIAFVAGLFAERTIQTELQIDAPAEIVWRHLMAFELYPDWNPFITRLSGKAAEGERLRVTIVRAGKDPMDLKPTVMAAKANREFRWVGRFLVSGLLDGEHYFILTPTSESTCRFVHGEKFRGVLALLMWDSLEPATRRGFVAMNAALKARPEADPGREHW